MIYLIARRARTRRLYNEIRNLWDSTDDPRERQSYKVLAYRARTLTIIFCWSCMCNVITFTTAAAVDAFQFEHNASNVDTSRHLPFDVW